MTVQLIQKPVFKQIIIQFNITSFSQYSFKIFCKKVLKKIKNWNLQTTKIVSLPIKTTRFTVLRSPHVDKKSREQFEIKSYKKVIQVTFNLEDLFEKQKAKLFINYIKNSSSGLSLKIRYKN